MWTRSERGLGIKKTHDVNAAILGKLGWKAITDAKNIWVKVYPLNT